MLLCLFCTRSLGQDTVQVLFDFGKATLSTGQLAKLEGLPRSFDLAQLDSIHFVGLADTVGNVRANMKLSQKRARNVEREISTLLPAHVARKTYAIGEREDGKVDENRRVDVLLFLKNVPPDSAVLPMTDSVLDERCFYVDYGLLHRSHAREVSKGKKGKVLILTTGDRLDALDKHYHTLRRKDGKVELKRVKWSIHKSDKWKHRTIYSASIPKSEFDRFRIFQIDSMPCKNCWEDVLTQERAANVSGCLQVDRFLMRHLEWRRRLFSYGSIKVRVPREYVDTNEKYYVGCDYQEKLSWSSQNGRKRKGYYFSDLPVSGISVPQIARNMACCMERPEYSECDKPLYLRCEDANCLGGKSHPSIVEYLIHGEIGYAYLHYSSVPYAGVLFSRESTNNHISLLAGTDLDLRFHGAIRYRYNFFGKSIGLFWPSLKWNSSNVPIIENIWTFQAYAGADLRTRLSVSVPHLLEQSINIGVAIVQPEYRARVTRIFVQGGIGYDYLRNYSRTIYPLFQAGMTVRIIKFKKPLKSK